MQIGHVSRLMRFPIRSMRGDAFDTLDFGTAGVAGDRIAALVDHDTGKVASAKLPHRWRRLLAFKARHLAGGDSARRPLIAIDLPDGRRIRSDREDIDTLLSSAIGRAVTLSFARTDGLEMDRARPDEVAEHGPRQDVGADTLPLGIGAPEGRFVDFAPVHFITSASLAHVTAALTTDRIEPERFRPNLVISTGDAAPFVENDWVGGTLLVGHHVTIEVMLATPRCALPTLAQGDIPACPHLIRLIGEMNRVPIMDMGRLACLGGYGRVVRQGPIRLGDAVAWIGR